MSDPVKYFFEIPIFSVAEDKFYDWIESRIEKLTSYFISSNSGIDYDYRGLAEKSFRGPGGYRYGQLVGMIRLYALDDQIRAEFRAIKQRPSMNLIKKFWVLEEMKIFPEFRVSDLDDNKQIYEFILSELEKFKKNRAKIKNCYMDLECFINSGSKIDYKAMVSRKT